MKNARVAEFLGTTPGKNCSITLNVTPRGAPSQLPGKRVMTHNDALAALQIYRMMDHLGANVTLLEPDSPMSITQVEFCIGGPRANSRTGRLLERYIPGVSMQDTLSSSPAHDPTSSPQDIVVEDGNTRYVAERQHREYAILARIWRQDTGQSNIIIVAGQTSDGNLPTVRFLESNLANLRREFRKRSFFLLVRMRDWDDNSQQYETVENILKWEI